MIYFYTSLLNWSNLFYRVESMSVSLIPFPQPESPLEEIAEDSNGITSKRQKTVNCFDVLSPGTTSPGLIHQDTLAGSTLHTRNKKNRPSENDTIVGERVLRSCRNYPISVHSWRFTGACYQRPSTNHMSETACHKTGADWLVWTKRQSNLKPCFRS